VGSGVNIGRHLLCGGMEGGILALDFHLEDLVCLMEGADLCVCQERDQAALESAESAFDFAFCLRKNGVSVHILSKMQRYAH